ncbi:CBS domain-containing protein [Flavobacterium sp.]|uniref:CBS domain-containing protein n=1 Tax=Flavobacterium sp. TaxID=239 RepID=UPI0025BCC86F|nr:CBS domain-containing protein [Flavobacterium sp.]
MEIEKLKQIKMQLDRGQPTDLVSVRTFLSWFGAQRRGWWVVSEIERTLNNLGLETKPHFNAAYIDGVIEFKNKIILSKENKDSTGFDVNTVEPENIAEKEKEEYYDDPTYRISKLEAANKYLTYVKPDSDLSEAITKMITYDYSQLPVMQQPKRDLKGVISWRSIGRKFSVGLNSAKVKDLMEPNYQLISYDTSLFKALPMIIEHDYVLVENFSKEICGIVTASDLSLQFKQLTEPFLLVAEIENYIRQILKKLSKEELSNAKDERDTERVIDTVADLTFGEYLRLFQNPVYWDKLAIKIDRKIFCEHLEKIKDVRNNIMHFDPDGLDEQSIDTLRTFVRLLQTLSVIKVF